MNSSALGDVPALPWNWNGIEAPIERNFGPPPVTLAREIVEDPVDGMPRVSRELGTAPTGKINARTTPAGDDETGPPTDEIEI